jgi:hypothetical protein
MTVPVPPRLPGATVDDLVDENVPRKALATAEDWQEWLSAVTGRQVWVDGELADETNYMARAIVGEVTGGYVKSVLLREGKPVWERVY